MFLFLESQPVPQSLANSFFFRKILVPPHSRFPNRLAASPTKYGAINLSPLMGTKGQSLIIHPGCQTMLAGCYLGWGRPIE